MVSRARKVLIVDDHDDLRKSIAHLLKAWGCSVAEAVDGPTALSAAKSFEPDVVILDLSLRDVSGLDVARRLRERIAPRQAYLIALTAFSDPRVRDACLAAGFDAYLVKPEGIVELEALLSSQAVSCLGGFTTT